MHEHDHVARTYALDQHLRGVAIELRLLFGEPVRDRLAVVDRDAGVQHPREVPLTHCRSKSAAADPST